MDAFPLNLETAEEIAEKIRYRQDHFDREDLNTSIMVVLLNYGDHLTEVQCVQGEWSGQKKDLIPSDSIPLCPNGHPLFEGMGKRLALIDEEMP